jgi:hypothetical protein
MDLAGPFPVLHAARICGRLRLSGGLPGCLQDRSPGSDFRGTVRLRTLQPENRTRGMVEATQASLIHARIDGAVCHLACSTGGQPSTRRGSEWATTSLALGRVAGRHAVNVLSSTSSPRNCNDVPWNEARARSRTSSDESGHKLPVWHLKQRPVRRSCSESDRDSVYRRQMRSTEGRLVP